MSDGLMVNHPNPECDGVFDPPTVADGVGVVGCRCWRWTCTTADGTTRTAPLVPVAMTELVEASDRFDAYLTPRIAKLAARRQFTPDATVPS